MWENLPHPQCAEYFSVEAADLTGSVVQTQNLTVAIAVAVIGDLDQIRDDYTEMTGKIN